jgi:hypothetical protein
MGSFDHAPPSWILILIQEFPGSEIMIRNKVHTAAALDGATPRRFQAPVSRHNRFPVFEVNRWRSSKISWF